MKAKGVDVTVIIACKNEAPNLEKCIRSLEPARRVVVVDSESTDGSQEIATSLGAEVVSFRYCGGYPKKRQWAMDHLDIETEWVLLVDADEVVTLPLWEEIAYRVRHPGRYVAFAVKKEFHFFRKRLRFGGFSFRAVILLRKGRGRFEKILEDDPTGMDMEVHERLIVDGPMGTLLTPLIHDDWKGLDAYLDRHRRYVGGYVAVQVFKDGQLRHRGHQTIVGRQHPASAKVLEIMRDTTSLGTLGLVCVSLFCLPGICRGETWALGLPFAGCVYFAGTCKAL
jgi:glycosyltransferase involved in cell wall biosynthesis